MKSVRAPVLVGALAVAVGGLLVLVMSTAFTQQSPMSRFAIGFAVVLGVAVTILPAVIRASRAGGDALEVSNLFMTLYALSALSLPVSYLLRPDLYFQMPDLILPGLGIFILGALGFWTGYHSRIGPTLVEQVALPQNRYDPTRLGVVAWTFIITGVLATATLIWLVGGWSVYAQANWLEKYRLSHGLGMLSIGMSVAEFGAVLLLWRAYVLRQSSDRLIPVLLLLAMLGFALFLGMRRLVFAPLLAIVIIYHYGVRAFRLREVIVPVIVAVALLGSFSHVRGYMSEGWYDLKGYVHRNAAWSWMDPAEGYFRAPFSNLTTILDAVPANSDHAYGRSYLEAPLILVPSAVFPGRPLTASQWYSREFFPEEFYSGGGRGFSSVTEAYWNFGILGVPVVLAAIGVLLRIFYCLCVERRGDFGTLLYALSGPFTVLAIVTIDFASAMKSFVIQSVFVALTLLATRRASAGESGSNTPGIST